MAQNMPASPPTHHTGNALTTKIAGLPLWSWGLIVIAGVGIGWFILRKQQQATSAAAQPPAAQALNDQIPSSVQVPNTTGDQVFLVPPTAPTTAPTTGTTDGSAQQTLTIRQPGKAPGYDQNNAGPPIWSSPGQNAIGEIPWGSTVTVTGIPVSGPSNTGQPGGSNIYYPVTFQGNSGFVSRFDLVGVGSGGPRAPRYTSNALSIIGEQQ